MSACASDSDGGATTASSLAVETAAAGAPAEIETATTTAETTTTTSDLSPAPPEAGEPSTVTIAFEDGETRTAPVSCDSDPDQDFFELSFRSGPDELPHFELLFFNTGEEVADWRTEDDSGTGVFRKADLTDNGEIQFTTPSGGQPLTTGG